jgi:uncharacterized protein (TIGR02466 family)
MAKAKKAAKAAPKKPQVNVFNAFPTHVITRQFEGTEDLNNGLEHMIMEKRIADPEGIYRSNASGTWHSDTGLLKWGGPPAKKLTQMFGQMFNSYCDILGGQNGGEYRVAMSAWAMMYQDRGYATCHTHPNCHFSGVYYVKEGPPVDLVMATGAKVRAGELEFVDTRGQAGHQITGLSMQPTLRIAPKAGMMVIFPQWLPHFVHPVVGDGSRISIACNANVSYTPPKKET